ncbi:hypothetical protein FQN60_003314 [Etheostoma spectabile]|uniref:Uncharacterized protein n=1 Tax=Etheostoma spectabile TaxID=54343 RepID=A0A5J5CLU2_9PERO|nr:hypothetical protein FQN60_003314 [Etheostoma spectabile]
MKPTRLNHTRTLAQITFAQSVPDVQNRMKRSLCRISLAVAPHQDSCVRGIESEVCQSLF